MTRPAEAAAGPAAERRLRVLLVVPGGVDASGEHRVIPFLLALIERLARRHDVHVVASQQYADPRAYPLLGAQVRNLGRPRRFGSWPGRTFLWRHRALAEAVDEVRPDVVHAFWATGPGLSAGMVAARRGLPFVLSLAGGELVALADIGYGAQRGWRGRVVARLALARADVVTCASGPMARLSIAHGRVPLRVPLGAPVPGATEAAATGPRGDGPPRLLFVGSLNRVKDPFMLLEAMRRVVDAEPGARLDVVGEDTLDGAVQRRAAALRLGDHVRFHGFRTSAALAGSYRSAELLVVTSRHEAGPVVAVEAAGWGVPTVGTHVGHLADAAGQWSETVPVGDAVALADAVLALHRDPERRARMGRAALAWARANDADATAARFEAIYRTVVARTSGPPA